MPPKLLNLLKNCFHRPVENDTSNELWKLNKKVRGEFNFVVPQKDYDRFAEMKPKDGAILTVCQYMFLYMYIIAAGNSKEPGPDFERVVYYFWDNSSLFVMKGWVPTKADERTLVANLSKKIRQFSPIESKSVYVKAKSSCTDDGKIPSATGLCDLDAAFGLRSESRNVPPQIFSGPPRVKSTYNWGVINTWSRHMAPESEDYEPVYIYDRLRQATLPSDSNISPLEMLDREIENAIEGNFVSENYGFRRPNKYNTMVFSTLDTRDRRVRPRAAKGQRTRHVITIQMNS
jgi:hypothetical protein